MNDDILDMDSDSVDRAVSTLNMFNADIDSSNEEVANSLKFLDGSETLSCGFKKLNSYVSTISDRVKEVSGSLQKQSDSMFVLENSLSNMVDDIEIPAGLDKTYSPTSGPEVNIDLSKRDGKAIKTDNTLTDVELDGFAKSKDVELSEMDSNGGLDKKELGDIEVNNQAELRDISNGNVITESSIGEDSEISEETKLRDINGGNLEKQELREIKKVKERHLGDISNGTSVPPSSGTLEGHFNDNIAYTGDGSAPMPTPPASSISSDNVIALDENDNDEEISSVPMPDYSIPSEDETTPEEKPRYVIPV